MSTFTPYTYFQCPCTDSSPPVRNIGSDSPTSIHSSSSEDEKAFDPRAPRANYSLYPLEHLLYCEDCHQIRCPRCVLDEIVTYYCPNCLFEVPSSTVKSEGTRCTRSCFQCPICIAPLSVSSLEAPPEGLGAEHASQGGPYVLNCPHCSWSSKEIGIQFDKPNGIFTQLSKIKNGGDPVITARERRKDREERSRDSAPGPVTDEDGVQDETVVKLDPNEVLDAESQFSNLKAFYQAQLAEASPANALGFSGGDYGYGSPGALSRIMGLYTGGTYADKKSKAKKGTMREAQNAFEGLKIVAPNSEDALIAKLQNEGWDATSSSLQRDEQSTHTPFISDLRPIAYLLRTKRSKRCKTCRHILSKPEAKIQTTRFRIRLVALNYIPSISIKPLQPLLSTQLQAPLVPMKPTQFLLTFKNPLFESVKVNIATPAQTPGRFASKITILCPQFEVGANTDAWEEALRDGSKGVEREKRRTKAEASEGQLQAEAGKVWERGRNWVSVVVEVIPASLKPSPDFLKTEAQRKLAEEGGEDDRVREDEDVVEIPVFVRVEWEADTGGEDGGLGKEKEGREKRELAYWCVLGVGRIG
ncbi:dynactin p62 family protein [Glarea lozoyensis ATCC 20868]|uniref:Dynactin subunit 4 n=1 Tax=Glarea lozoyensis (strain ATCC 20868 / MF5171) TaxID=1116229 RepID=S3CJD0_GLAL2|nr:dynactin p62 family protein [Glarea lozoyensis ATCC 20868]EPE25905.1 dynactin p62 family protein [Glarea lozoyensis ATCC 20868]